MRPAGEGTGRETVVFAATGHWRVSRTRDDAVRLLRTAWREPSRRQLVRRVLPAFTR
jgi:hypothetical protein